MRCQWTHQAGHCKTYGEAAAVASRKQQRQQQFCGRRSQQLRLIWVVSVLALSVCLLRPHTASSLRRACNQRDPHATHMRTLQSDATCLLPSISRCSIRHTIVLDDPFDDPAQLADLIPDASPPPTFEHVSSRASSPAAVMCPVVCVCVFVIQAAPWCWLVQP